MNDTESNNKSLKEDKKDLNIIKLEKGETVNVSRALGSRKRLDILKFTSQEELNLSEIAEKINSTPQAVYHHLQILEESKLIKVVREESIKNMDKTIKYYRSNFHPDGINLLLWAPIENIEATKLEKRVPIPKTPVLRISRKIADKLFVDSTEFKIEVLTEVVKGLVDKTHESMLSLREEYGLELDDKIWNLVLYFSQLSAMNAFKKIIEEEELKKHFENLVLLLNEEFMDLNGETS